MQVVTLEGLRQISNAFASDLRPWSRQLQILLEMAEALAPFDCPRTAASLRSSLCLRVIYPCTRVCMYSFVLVCTALCMEMFLKEHFAHMPAFNLPYLQVQPPQPQQFRPFRRP